jgi:hypothetical protein
MGDGRVHTLYIWARVGQRGYTCGVSTLLTWTRSYNVGSHGVSP